MEKLFKPLLFGLIFVVMLMSDWSVTSVIAAEQEPASSIVVKLKTGLTASEQAAVVTRNGGVETSSVPPLRMHVIAIPTGQDPNLILQNYQSDPQVERAELNKERQAEAMPNDISYGVQWALSKIGWDEVFGTVIPSGTATIALLDTGVYANHPDLGDNVILPGTSILDPSSDGRTDSNGHGTWLAGIIGAITDNGEGIAGVCSNGVKILPVTVLNGSGVGRDSDIIAGIAWAADHGANVILMGFSNADFSQSLQDAIDYAWEKGAVLVAAAGNAGVITPTYPAGDRGVIGVSSTTQDDILATSSNYGQSILLAAPGENIYTTNNDSQNPYTYISGTSASSAVVAGVAAFMKAVDPNLTNGVIVGRLAKSADPIGTAGDPNNTLLYGNGRINMANALASTSTDSIQPAGAAPIGEGGPYVGPYVAATEFEIEASYRASTATISVYGEGFVSTWMYQYAYQSPSGSITYHPCTAGSSAAYDQLVLPSGFQTGTWKIYLLAYNPSYTTCLNNGTATRTATTTTYVNVTPAYLTVTPASGTYGGTVNLSATLTIGTPLSGKTVTFSLNGSTIGSAVTNGSGVASLYNVPLVPGTINAGVYPAGIGANFAGDGIHSPSSAVGSLTVVKATPSVTAWPTASPINVGQALSSSILSGGSASVAGSFSFALPATVPSAGVYNASVIFTPSDSNYNTVSGTVNVTVGSGTAPSVTAWPAASAITYGQPLSASTLTGGSASVAGSFSFAVPTTVPNAGTYTATVIFTPSDSYYSTVSGSVEVVVNKAVPGVTAWPTASVITYGQPLSASTLTGGSASVPGSFSFSAPATIPNAGSYSAGVTFTPSDTNYGTVSGNVVVMVNRAVASVTAWPAASAITYGQSLSASTLTGGTATVDGSFTFAAPATIPNAGTYTAAVLFTPSDANYIAVNGSISVVVNKAIPSVTAWPTASAISFGQPLSASTLSGGSASVPGSFSFAAPTIVPAAGTYSAAVIFTPSDTNHSSVNGSVDVAVNKAVSSVTAWPTASNITYGQTLASSTLTGGSASVSGTFAFTTSATVPNAGTTAQSVTFTPTDNSNYNTVTGSVNVTVEKATPSVSAWPTASAINYGQTLASSTLAGGSASVSGSFTFTTSTITPGVGTEPQSVIFTPTDTVNYNTVIGSVNVTVNKTTPSVITWPTASNITYGQTLAASTLTGGSASVPGTFAFTTPSTSPAVGTAAHSVTFTPTDTTNYNTVTGSVNVTVDKATLTVTTWPTASVISYGQTLASSALTGGSASVSGTFAFTTPSTSPAVGTAAQSVTFIPTDTTNYNTVTGSVNVTVNKAATTITVGATTTITVSQSATFTATVTPSVATGTIQFQVDGANVGSPVTLTAGSTTSAPVSGLSAGNHTVTAIYSGDANYYTSTSTGVPQVVNNLTATTTTVGATTTIIYGQSATFTATVMPSVATGTIQFRVDGVDVGSPVTVTAGSATSAPVSGLTAGSRTVTAVYGGDSIYNTSTSTGVTQVVNKATSSVTTWPLASAISYGQQLAASMLTGGSASVVGSFSFDAPSTILNAGTHSVAVTFTPGDGANFTTVSGSVSINVTPLTQSITFGTLPDMGFGSVPFALSATATSGLPVSFASLTTAVCTVAGDTVTIAGVGTCTIEATQPGNINYYAATPISQSFSITSGGLDHFAISTVVTPQVAGVPFAITITAQDAWNHTITSFVGTVDLSTTAGTITPTVTPAFVDGVWTGTVMVTGAGVGKTITVTESARTWNSNTFDVNAGAAVAFTVTAPAIASAGVPFDITVTAKDSLDNIVAGYAGTVHFTSTDTKVGIALPSDYSFLASDNGTKTFTGIVLETAGTQTITAGDTVNASLAGTSGSIAVSPAGAAKLSLTAPATATAGNLFSLTVAVKDAYDNIITGYTGTLGFTSSDPQAVLPSDYTFVTEDNGSHIFAGLNLKTAGTQTITATDKLVAAITGTSGSIAIGPDVAQTLVFSQQPVNFVPNQPIAPAVAVSLMDQFGNVVTNSTDEVTITLASGSHSGSLGGTTTRSVVSGVAIFADLSISPEGNGYMLSATSGSLPSVNSNLFDLIIGTCGKPAALTVPASGNTGTITITWSASNVSGSTYILEQSKDGGPFTQVYSGTNTSAIISLTASGTYTYRVKATKDGYDPSDYTAGSNACVALLICGAPPALTVPATNTTGLIRITWGASDISGATYILEQSQDGGPFVQVYSGLGTSANVSVNLNGTYTYRVKATKDGFYPSVYTVGSNGCAVHLICGAPADLAVPATNSTGNIWINWGASDVLGATYVLEQSQDGGPFTVVYSGPNIYANIVVTANATYTYRVKAQKTNYETSGYTVGINACAVHLACGAPPDLTVPSINSTGTYSITWSPSDVGGATYVVEQSKDGGPFTQVYSGPYSSTTINVTANGTYTYRVKAQKFNYDTSSYTPGNVGCVVHLACGAPLVLNVPATNSTGVMYITWSPSDVSGSTYVLEQSKDGGPFTQVYSGVYSSASVTVTANGTYTYRVKAQKTNYDTSSYTVDTVGCLVHLACGAPPDLVVPPTNSTGIISINWSSSDVGGATYVLEQSNDGGPFVQVYSGLYTSANVSVAANGSYTYRVKAQKTNYDTSGYTVGNGACAVHLACGAPSGLMVPVTNSTGTIYLTWSPSDVSDATYVLEQSKDGGAFTQVYSGPYSSANINVIANGTYTYRVKAQKTNYDTSSYIYSSNGCLVHLACSTPASLNVPASNSTGSIYISWSASDVSGATYILEQSKDGGAFVQVYSGQYSSTNITVTANGTYTYRVKAQKTNYDTSNYTAVSSGCMVYLICGTPASLTVPSSANSGTIYLTWSPSDVSGATYVVEQSKDGGPFTQVYSGPYSFANITVTANGTYTYRVKAQKTNYTASDWTAGNTSCAVMLYSKVRLTASGQTDTYFTTLAAAISAMPNSVPAALTTWNVSIIENLNLDIPNAVLTIGSAYDTSYTTPSGPTVIRGNVTVTSGTLITENLVIL